MPNPKIPRPSSATDLVRELADILNETGLSEIEVEREGQRVRVAKTLTSGVVQTHASSFAPASAAAATAPPVPAIEPEATHAGETVTSPMVGTVYLQPQPGAPPFVKVGDTVAAGQTLFLVEAMKTMNPIPAPRAGVVLELLVTDSQPIEFGEPLAVIG